MSDSPSERLTALVESLTGDLLFAMSRGSKELFHSDTLAWYLEHFGFLREALLDAWQVPQDAQADGGPRVLREWRNLDLVVHHAERRPLVVENKVFSLPDTAQLDGYAARKLHDLDDPSLVLLSLVDPGWPTRTWTTPTGPTWHYRGYDDLCAALRPCLPELRRRDGLAADVFERWLALLDNLVELASCLGAPAGSEPLLLPAQDSAVLQRARLDATVQKMRYLHTARRIQVELAGEITAGKVLVQTAMSRGQGIVEMFTAYPGPGFGWQIQEGQFRLVYLADKGPGHGPGRTQREIREQQARANSDYFSFDQARELLGNTGPERPAAAPNGPLPFNGFAPDFVYRSIPVPELTVDQVVRLGVIYARRALDAHLEVGSGAAAAG